MDFYKVAELVEQFGYPVVLSLGMGYFIYYVWNFITKDLKPTLSKSHGELIRLLDQIRMLDNDLIRLQQKVDAVLELKETLAKEDKNERKKNEQSSK